MVSVWRTVSLVGGYIALQLIADVCAVKIVDVFGITVPAGVFVFALTFTWLDLIHKRLGIEWVRASIVAATLCNLLMAFYFLLAVQLPPASFWAGQAAFSETVGIVWRVVLSSIVAELVSEMVDAEVYHVVAPWTRGKWQFVRVLSSNGAALLVDTVLFIALAFGGTMPVGALVSIAVGQVVVKAVITLVSMPVIYLIEE
jgi:uncharacterized integral membrane protein (TIGR00697 family)